MKTVAYTSALLWVVASILLSGCSAESNQSQVIKPQQSQPPARAVLNVDYIDNDISLLGFDLNEELIHTPIKTYSL